MHTQLMQATLGHAISDKITASQRFGQATAAAETTRGVSNNIVAGKIGKPWTLRMGGFDGSTSAQATHAGVEKLWDAEKWRGSVAFAALIIDDVNESVPPDPYWVGRDREHRADLRVISSRIA